MDWADDKTDEILWGGPTQQFVSPTVREDIAAALRAERERADREAAEKIAGIYCYGCSQKAPFVDPDALPDSPFGKPLVHDLQNGCWWTCTAGTIRRAFNLDKETSNG